MSSRSSRFKKFYSKKYIIVYYFFSVAVAVLYLLHKDDMQNEISNIKLIFTALWYGIIITILFTLCIRTLVYLYKKSRSQKRRKKQAEV
jgi:uncharacterized membrane protein YvlD (DUF360 family)